MRYRQIYDAMFITGYETINGTSILNTTLPPQNKIVMGFSENHSLHMQLNQLYMDALPMMMHIWSCKVFHTIVKFHDC